MNFRNKKSDSELEKDLEGHLHLQKHVALFNHAFSPLLINGFFSNIILTLIIFYNVINLKFDHPSFIAVQSLLGLWCFSRFFMVFYVLAQVKCK